MTSHERDGDYIYRQIDYLCNGFLKLKTKKSPHNWPYVCFPPNRTAKRKAFPRQNIIKSAVVFDIDNEQNWAPI